MTTKTPTGIVIPPSSKPFGKVLDPSFIKPAGGRTPLGEVSEKPDRMRPTGPGPSKDNPPKTGTPPKK